MLNHFSVSSMAAISNDPNDLGYAFQVAMVESLDDGSSKTNVYKVKATDTLATRLEEIANLLLNFKPTATTLEAAKFLKLSQIQNAWNQQLKTGWNSGQGRLGLTAEDVALISGAYSLAKEASVLGLPLPSLVTLENTVIEFASLGDMTQMMLMYGAARSQLSIQYAAKRKAVEEALTIEEVEAV